MFDSSTLGLDYTYYRIHPKNSSHTVARNICHIIAINIGMNKMAEADEYLDCLNETLEWAAKP